MKEVYAIKKSSQERHDNAYWHDIELFESEDDAIMVLSLEAGKHLNDLGFTWDGKDLTWTSGNWSYNWWLDKIPIVESGTIVSDIQNKGEKDTNVTDEPKKEFVYACKHWKYEYDDLGKYSMCYNRNCKLQTCDCKRIYAQQFCPFYEKGEVRGKWVIDDVDKQAAEEFKKKFEGKEDK